MVASRRMDIICPARVEGKLRVVNSDGKEKSKKETEFLDHNYQHPRTRVEFTTHAFNLHLILANGVRDLRLAWVGFSETPTQLRICSSVVRCVW